jgi:hypothetical protein
MKKTLVLNIDELYEVIPSTKRLEGKNFKDISELLKELITAIEDDAQWDFIQYVNNKPSLFIVREATPENNSKAELEQITYLKGKAEEILRKIESTAVKVNAIVSDSVQYQSEPIPEPEPPEHRETIGSYVPPVKLPWEE